MDPASRGIEPPLGSGATEGSQMLPPPLPPPEAGAGPRQICRICRRPPIEVMNNLGNALRAAGRMDEAAECYERVCRQVGVDMFGISPCLGVTY